MFHTLTLNPSLDYLVFAKEFVPGALNRADSARLFAGGKGVNVALMLHRLGQPARALGFLAGETGRALQRMLAAEGLPEDFLFLPSGATRVNLKLETPAASTELNAPGPAPDPAALAALEAQLAAIPAGDTLIAAGSLPPGLAPDTCARLLAPCAARGVRCVLDTSGPALAAGLAARPWLIKPNLDELAELTGLAKKGAALWADDTPTPPPPGTEQKAAAGGEGQEPPAARAFAGKAAGPGPFAPLRAALRAAQRLGAQNVLASLGGQGAALLTETGEFFYQPAPAGRPVNPAGAGDSLLAGFLAGLARAAAPADALRLGVAAGSATAFCPWLAAAEDVQRLRDALAKAGTSAPA